MYSMYNMYKYIYTFIHIYIYTEKKPVAFTEKKLSARTSVTPELYS